MEKGFPDEPRQSLQVTGEPKFSSKIEELQYYGTRTRVQEAGENAEDQREISLMEALTILNAFRIGDDE